MQVINPATEEVREIEETNIDSLPDITNRARQVQKEWCAVSLDERVGIIKNLLTLVTDRKEELAKTVTQDMGKPYSKALGEVEILQKAISFYSEHAAQWLAPEKASIGTTLYQPLGVVAVIAPWNFPLGVPSTGILPALIAGNAVIFKPSEQTLFTGKALYDLFDDLPEFPKGALQLVIGGKEHGKSLVEQDIDMVHFTGSTAAGKHIMSSCSDSLKRVLLELGGMDAAIVLKDADIPLAAKSIVRNNCNNTGQVCCAIKRVYVEQEVYEKFVAIAAEEAKQITCGDPMTEVDMGPLVANFQLEKVSSIVEDAKDKGATVLAGGQKLNAAGYFYPPTLLVNVDKNMRVLTEEPFGPVLPIIPVKDQQEAIEQANNSQYGLTGSVWTKDMKKASAVAEQLIVGSVGINRHGPGPLGAPFGGARQSGIGRVKSKDTFRNFCNTKFVDAI